MSYQSHHHTKSEWQSYAAKAAGKDICQRKHQGNEESVAAFERASNAMPKQRAEILRLIRNAENRGMTCKEAAEALKVGMNHISGRFSELKRDRLIEQIGSRDNSGVYVAK